MLRPKGRASEETGLAGWVGALLEVPLWTGCWQFQNFYFQRCWVFTAEKKRGEKSRLLDPENPGKAGHLLLTL